MAKVNIYCEEYDFAPLAKALEGEFEADCDVSAEIVFYDKPSIRELNARTRGIDRETDVLSYPTLDGILGKKIIKAEHAFEVDEDGAVLLGSIVICTDVAREQAQEYGHSYERELFYLAVHGMCHLLGYDHIEEDDRRVMRAKEEKILAVLGLTRED